jgi:hypothetical protein
MTQRDAEKSAAAALAALSDRMNRAAQSLTRMVARLATEDGPAMSISFVKYVNAGMPEAENVADIAAMLDGAQPPEEQESGGPKRGDRASGNGWNGSYRAAGSRTRMFRAGVAIRFWTKRAGGGT